MAKRFTDTEKWKKNWYCSLEQPHKLFWGYLLDNCSYVGIWDVNWPLASFLVGSQLDPEETAKVFRKQFIPLDEGRRWFIVDFIEFQYGNLNPNANPHKGVISTLQKLSLLDGQLNIILPTNPSPTLPKGSPTPKDKDQGKDQDQNKDQGKEKRRSVGLNGSMKREFESVWSEYPRKSGRPKAEDAFRSSVKSPEDLVLFRKAMENHLASVKGREQFMLGGSRFFAEWPDWVNPTEAMMRPVEPSKLQQSRPSDFSKFDKVLIS